MLLYHKYSTFPNHTIPSSPEEHRRRDLTRKIGRGAKKKQPKQHNNIENANKAELNVTIDLMMQ